jgi:hypothetical protein
LNSRCMNDGGYCLYGAFNRNFRNDGMVCDGPGYTCTSTSGGLKTKITNISCAHEFFCYKGGFGSPVTVSNDCNPTLTTFCVTGGLETFAPGTYLEDISGKSMPLAGGYVREAISRNTYLIITLTKPAVAAISAGDGMLALETGTVVDHWKINNNSSNGFDENGVKDLTITNGSAVDAGRFNTRLYLGAIWIGFDPYAGNNKVNSDGVVIRNFNSVNSAGTAISLQGATSDIDVSSFDLDNGIASNTLTYYRAHDVHIHDGTIKQSGPGEAVEMSYGQNDTLTNVTIGATDGVELTSEYLTTLTGNHITASDHASGGYVFRIGSTGNPTGSINFKGNVGSVSGGATPSYGIFCADSTASLINLAPNNVLTGVAGFLTVGGDANCVKAVSRSPK